VIEHLSAFHGFVHRDIPTTENKVIRMNHGKNVADENDILDVAGSQDGRLRHERDPMKLEALTRRLVCQEMLLLFVAQRAVSLFALIPIIMGLRKE
jgi:hypothetical protein